jgi:hypothetical protein
MPSNQESEDKILQHFRSFGASRCACMRTVGDGRGGMALRWDCSCCRCCCYIRRSVRIVLTRWLGVACLCLCLCEGGLETDRSQLRPPKVSIVFAEALSAQKAIFIGENMAMSVGGHTITVSLASGEGGGGAAAKRRKVG